MRSKPFARVIAAALCAAVAGCATDSTGPGGPVPGIISASVVDVRSSGDGFTILADGVGGTSGADDPVGRFYLITSRARPVLVHRTDGSVRNGTVDDIVPGVTVRAWLTGVELRSAPPQYPTTRIDVIPAGGR